MIFFTADQHFGHWNINKYAQRGYESLEEMNNHLIQCWNSRVGPDGVVYQLGDLTLGGAMMAQGFLERLRGEIHIVPGYHDHRWTKGIEALFPFARIEPPLLSLEIPLDPDRWEHPLVIALCHYPLRAWDRGHHGAIHLYGHVHGKLRCWPCTLDVGVDAIGPYPISLVDVLKKMELGHLVEDLDRSIL